MEVAAADLHFFAFWIGSAIWLSQLISRSLPICENFRRMVLSPLITSGRAERVWGTSAPARSPPATGEDRPAGGERVGGGAGRRGDDQAVGALREGEAIVDVHLEFDHVRHFAGVQHHFVDGGAEAALLVLFMHDGFQQETLFVDVLAFQHVRQLLQGVVDRDR